MDSDDELIQLSDSENQPERKLKRLRKAKDSASILSPPSDDDVPLSSHDVNSASSPLSESLDTDSDTDTAIEPNADEDLNEFEGSEEATELDSVFNVDKTHSGAKRPLVFDSEVDEELDSVFDVDETHSSAKRPLVFDSEFDEEITDPAPTHAGLETETENDIQNQNLDEFKEKKKKKKKKRAKSADDDFLYENLSTAAPTKKMREKERRERLNDLRSESQRLLRETRDVSFKPVPLVQKSVSSVLEKIRQRKHELYKKLDSFIDDNDTISREVASDFDFENSPIKNIAQNFIQVDGEETTMPSVDVEEGGLGDQNSNDTKDTLNDTPKTATPQKALNEVSKQTFRAPVDDTQDLIFDSQTSDSKDELSGEMPSSPLEDVMAPSLLAMNLKLDSAPPDDLSSDEEDNDKENIDPCLRGSAGSPSSPKGDPVKAFVDDEAEEEDDSDNELARFKENEEEDDIMDAEELNDIIATGYEEKQMDNEMRNQLHQKWLEQQDAAGTENLLQRLKCGSKQRETALIEEEDEEDEDGEEDEEDFLDDPADCIVPKNAVRMNLKKAKEMICQMFTDKDDLYVSSDDEETEERLAKQQLSDKTEEKAKFLSPAEDEGSKEIFGLIKKLNAVPDTRRRAKITSHFHTLSIGGKKNTSLKSSFLSLRSRNSLPSFQKHGSSTVRSFVFERDDSNSRSAISMSEDSSDVVPKESRPRKAPSAKYSSSQVRSSAQNSQTIAENTSGPSLHEILRCQSLQSSRLSGGNMASHIEAIYASFKLDQNLVKKDRGVSMRTI